MFKASDNFILLYIVREGWVGEVEELENKLNNAINWINSYHDAWLAHLARHLSLYPRMNNMFN